MCIVLSFGTSRIANPGTSFSMKSTEWEGLHSDTTEFDAYITKYAVMSEVEALSSELLNGKPTRLF